MILPPVQRPTLPFTTNFLKELFKCVLQSITKYLQPCAPLPVGEVGCYSALKLMPLTLMPVSLCEATQSKFMQIILPRFCPLLSELSRHRQFPQLFFACPGSEYPCLPVSSLTLFFKGHGPRLNVNCSRLLCQAQ